MRARTESASARGICHDLAFSIARARPENVTYVLRTSRVPAARANGKSAQTATMPRHHRVERRNRSRGTTDGDGRCRQSVALTRPGPTCFSKTGSLRSGRHMLHCWAPLSSATAVLSSVALESLAGAGATVTVRGARTSVTSHLWLHRTHRERQGFLIRELPGFLIRSFWVLQFTIWGCMAPRSPRSPAPPASCE